MRPISLEFQCFGPYMDKQVIDFADLGNLFLICGETGAGKTTILDAICYALYAKSSGGLRQEMEVMRCQLAGKQDKTLVEFVFEVNGRRYKFTRSLTQSRKNLNDEHNCLEFRDGVYVPLLANPKKTNVNEMARQIIGLTYEQFRQVIILPQGQFEELLVSKSEEKEKILVTLFNANRWQKACDALKIKVEKQNEALKLRLNNMQQTLLRYQCEDLDALTARQEELTQQLEQLKKDSTEAIELAKAADQAFTEAQLENKDFEELEKRQTALNGLLAQEAAMHREEDALSLARDAEQLRPAYQACQQAIAAENKARSDAEKAEKQQTAAKTAQEKAAQARDAHQAAAPAHEENRKEHARLTEARDLYETLAQKAAEASATAEAVTAAQEKADAANMIFQQKDTAYLDAVSAHDQALQAYAHGNARYASGICGHLAAELLPDAPCPVCGSTAHPAPAPMAEDSVTEAELKKLEKAESTAKKAVITARSARDQASEAHEAAKAALQEARQQQAAANAAYTQARAGMIEGIDSTADLEHRIAHLAGEIRRYEADTDAINQAIIQAEADLKAAGSEVSRTAGVLVEAVSTAAAAGETWSAQLIESPFADESAFLAAGMDPEEQQRRSHALSTYLANLDTAKNAVAQQLTLVEGKIAPDLERLKAAKAEAEAAKSRLEKAQALAENDLKDLTDDLTALRAEDLSCQTLQHQVTADLDFVKRLLGSNGISLQRYVLGVMLSSITAAANQLLQNVYGGRYQLFRSDRAAGSTHKKGLELEVFDRQNNECRSVTTLSGGEKFLVALSLAVGLSEVVQAQGRSIRMEAMFIDEGFGTLSQDAVGDALEILQSIRNGSGMVGIISHVDQLRETIPVTLEARKGKGGSNLVIL